jgi:hypothetical protein
MLKKRTFVQEMEAKPDSSNAQKYESGTGDVDTQATLALSYFAENNLQSDAVLRLEDGGTLPVYRETLSMYSEYFRFVWLGLRDMADSQKCLQNSAYE